MRALLWRYVRSLQKKNEERPISEDDINEVKGDISSLRLELTIILGKCDVYLIDTIRDSG